MPREMQASNPRMENIQVHPSRGTTVMLSITPDMEAIENPTKNMALILTPRL